MTIIVIVVCLFAERFLSSLYVLRNFTWLENYTDFVLKYFSSIRLRKGKVPVLFIVLPPTILVGFVDQQLYHLFLPLEFLFSIIVLLYCFGPQTFYDRSKALCDAKNANDKDCACWYAEKILERPLDCQEKSNLAYTITKSLFIISNDRILAPIFWFALLGPMGAILFRCSSQLYFLTHKQENTQLRYKRIAYSANFLYAIMNWIPSRLSAIGFAAMGNFSNAMKNFSKIKSSLIYFDQESNDLLLSAIGGGSINLPEPPQKSTTNNIADALAILRRNTQLWMGAIALLTLAGWLV